MVDKYLMNYYRKELRKKPILTAEEERALCTRVKSGDRLAQNRLIEGSLRTVWEIATKYNTDEVDLSDLIQEGNLGLIHAAEKFDPSCGVRFNTYAIFWVRQHIQRYFHQKSRLIRIPVDREVMAHRIRVFRESFLSNNGRNATIDEVAHEVGKSAEYVADLITDMMPCTSLDFIDKNEEEGYNYHSFMGDMRHNPEECCCAESQKTILAQAMGKLSDRDREIIKMRYGFYDKEYTLAEVSERQGLTIERCRQLQKAAVEQMAAFCRKIS